MENYYKLDKKILNKKDLNISEKVIYSIIANLSCYKGYCWASNKQLEEITNINEKTIQRAINKLHKLNYVNKWKRKNGKLIYRFLTTNDEIAKRDIKEIVEESKHIKEVFSYDWLHDEE